ncbi:MAG: ABC transporter ATP-binding protein [Christensenellales bacterium]
MTHLLKYIKKKDWFIIAICLGLIVLQVFLELKMPDYTKALTTMVQSESANMAEVWKNGGLMLACALGSLLSAIVCSVLISRVASSFSLNLRQNLFAKISDFSNTEINKFSTASLITRTTNDVMQMQNFVAMGIQLLFKAPIMAVWAILKISATHVSWTTAMIICVAIIVICVCILIALCLPRFKKIQKLTDELNNVTRESVGGVRVVRAFNAEDYQQSKFEKVNDQITKTNLFTSRAMGFLSPIMTLCMNGLTLAIYWIAAVLVNDIAFSGDAYATILQRSQVVGNAAAFSSYAMQVVMAFMMLIMIFIILPRTVVSGNRIWEVLSTKPSIVYKNSGNIKTDKVGEIEFKNVSFAFDDGDDNALTDITFKVNKGETVAIIGATGSGKTTIINLLSRFYDVTSGQILIDGVDIKDYSEKELRSKIALASQKASLFKGTVKENITFGSDVVDDEKVNRAIDIAQADFIYKLDDGVNSNVAQGGTNFSGGQKQRISLARAVYKDSEIMVFDDTFSALDYKTDMLARKAIHQNLSDKTIVIIAQRIGTIKNADKILVIDEGKIVGEGKHDDLLKTCNVYKEIALSQLSKEEL